MADVYLQHHGIKGQRWGVRRYQYADGSLTPAGRKRYLNGSGGRYNNRASSSTSRRPRSRADQAKRVASLMSMEVTQLVNSTRTVVTGRQYVDGYLAQGTTFSRIQTSPEFENFAFYATYRKDDMDKYMGLFGKNLRTRAEADARRAEKAINDSSSEEDIANAKALREKFDNLKVYQVKLETTKKLKIPSDENASDITAQLLKDPEFKKNLEASIQDSKEKMKRPTQQMLFNQAQSALQRDPSKMSATEKVAVYKAFNLSLTNHNEQEIAAQAKFYGELKKKGYNALLDYNDREYSSYHAKRPMIVFDTESVKLQAVVETNPKIVDKLYTKYNSERVAKEAIANTLGLLSRMGETTVAQCNTYVNKKMDDYMSS